MSVMLRHFIQKLHKGLLTFASRAPALSDVELDEEMEVATAVPDDVKEGYFTVFAVKGKEAQRFVIKLKYLNNPAFLTLLEMAREEYGFRQKGILSVPCLPVELQNIISEKKGKTTGSWATCNNASS